jgi:hypothetical protein
MVLIGLVRLVNEKKADFVTLCVCGHMISRVGRVQCSNFKFL